MGERTGIQWTDATWNPWRGCHKVSPADTNLTAADSITRLARCGRKAFSIIPREEWSRPLTGCSLTDYLRITSSMVLGQLSLVLTL